MSIKMIALATINKSNPEAAKAYSAKAQELVTASNGKVISKHLLLNSEVGSFAPDVTLTIEFETTEKAKEFLNSDAYTEIIPLRKKGFESMHIYLTE